MEGRGIILDYLPGDPIISKMSAEETSLEVPPSANKKESIMMEGAPENAISQEPPAAAAATTTLAEEESTANTPMLETPVDLTEEDVPVQKESTVTTIASASPINSSSKTLEHSSFQKELPKASSSSSSSLFVQSPATESHEEIFTATKEAAPEACLSKTADDPPTSHADDSHDTDSPSSSTTISVLHLPLDALLHITRYDTCAHAMESWSLVHSTCRTVTSVALRHVHQHALQCALEIHMASLAREYSDAQALVQVYQQHGIDIYPAAPPEHVWKTLAWRYQRQVVQEQESQRRPTEGEPPGNNNHNNNTASTRTLLTTVDPFLAHLALHGPAGQPPGNHAQPQPRPRSNNTTTHHNSNNNAAFSYVQQKEHFHQARNNSNSNNPTTWRLHEHLWNQHCIRVTPPFANTATNSRRRRRRTQPLHLAADMYHATQPQHHNHHSELPEHVQLYSAQQPPYSDLRSPWTTAQAIYQSFAQRLATLDPQNISAVRRLVSDFWDVLLPATQYVALWDGHTAVPRQDCLEQFCQRPLPPSWGIVQCEIERRKTKRPFLFPQYEYRLFIRQEEETEAEQPQAGDNHPRNNNNNNPPRRAQQQQQQANARRNDHPNDAAESDDDEDDEEDTATHRHDVALLAAQPVGKKATNGIASSTKDSKKANKTTANHYGLYLPSSENNEKRGKSVGRLQGNFIGTEFQLFVPTAEAKRANQPVGASPPPRTPPSRSVSLPVGFASSDGEKGYVEDAGCNDRPAFETEDGYDSDPAATARRSSTKGKRKSRLRFSRFLRSSSNLSSSPPTTTAERSHEDMLPGAQTNSQKRHVSRRAIANESLSSSDNNLTNSPSRTSRSNTEEENAVITYTANLLGSRPRIMDVCIPRVNEQNEVNPNAGWKEQGMLPSFKRLQQRGDTADATTNDTERNNADNHPDGQAGTNAGHAVNDALQDGTISSTNPDLGLWALQNRPPWWNVELGSFVLNFGGRVSVASVKNFQLVDRAHNLQNQPGDNGDATILLQFGRIQGRHSFTMDFQHPLSPVQAFSIAISSLQSKISFG